jgi:hypothetical protein
MRAPRRWSRPRPPRRAIQIDIGDDSQDHLIKPEDRLTIAMARQ